MQNVRNVKLPDPKIISGIVQTAVFGGAGAYGLYHSFFNVEGGHRAIVYNRFVGIREKVRHGCDGHVTGMFSPPRSSLNAMDRFEQVVGTSRDARGRRAMPGAARSRVVALGF